MSCPLCHSESGHYMHCPNLASDLLRWERRYYDRLKEQASLRYLLSQRTRLYEFP